jgi:hypothetical protein
VGRWKYGIMMMRERGQDSENGREIRRWGTGKGRIQTRLRSDRWASPNLDETGPQEPRNRIDGRKSLWENWVATMTGASQLSVASITTYQPRQHVYVVLCMYMYVCMYVCIGCTADSGIPSTNVCSVWRPTNHATSHALYVAIRIKKSIDAF